MRTGINDGPPNSIIRHDDRTLGVHERAVHDLGIAAETIAELKRQLAATQDSYEKVSELAETLTATLRGIRDANYKEWDEELNNPREFVRWAKSVANSALTPKN